jgi:signal transduction histidine kinase
MAELPRHLLRLFLPIVLLFWWATGESQVIDASRCDSAAHFVITRSASFLRTLRPVSIDSVLRSEGRFQPPFDKDVSVGNYDPYYYWFRIIISNPRDRDRQVMLLMAPMGLYDGRLLQRIGGDWKEVAHSGLKYRFGDRSYPFIHHVFPFTLPAGTVDTLYFSIDARNAYKLFGFALFGPTQLKLFEGNIYFVFGIIVGLLILFFALNVSLFFALRKPLHLWYALYIALLFPVVMKNDQLDQQFLELDSELAFRLTPYAAIGALAIAVLLHVVQQFLCKVLEPNRVLSRISTTLKVNVTASALVHAVVFFTADDSRVENIVFAWVKLSVLACICMLIVNCVYALRKKEAEAIFLLCGSFVFTMGSLQRLFFAGSLSFLFPPTTFHIGIILEVFIISMALIYRYWYEREQERDEREKIRIDTINAISAEIHDNIGPTLTLASLNLKRIDFARSDAIPAKLIAAGSFTDIAISDIRDLSRTLKEGPQQLREVSEEIRDQCLDFEGSSGIRTVCEIRTEAKLTSSQQGSLLRIIKEALNNITKHAQTEFVEVVLDSEDGLVLLTIRDEGVGFDVARVFPGSNGLQNMHNRCLLMNAGCRIESGPGRGTKIEIKLPVSSRVS